jgi:hypothetical protein
MRAPGGSTRRGPGADIMRRCRRPSARPAEHRR